MTSDLLLRRSDAEDNCDDCGRGMPLTGAQLCRGCEADDEARRMCIVCRKPKIWLDVPTCSEECADIYEGWPEP